MGLSFSLLSSTWEVILRHGFLDLPYDLENLENRLRTNSFKKPESESEEVSNTSSDSQHSSPRNTRRNSIISKSCEPLKVMLQTTLSFKNLVQDIRKTEPDNSNLETGSKNLLPEPVLFFSPRPISELNGAATTVQKIYKSYRTRRNLADGAVVAEELWWKTLDTAALERSSVTFFHVEKHETAVSRWARAGARVAKVGKGLLKDEKAQKLALQHWLEAIDPRHRYGHNLHIYYDLWFESESCQPFFYWLDVGDGKEVNLEKCPRSQMQKQCIKYLGPIERAAYEVIVEDGKLVFRQTGSLLETTEGSKWIFVLSTSRNLYVGQKKKGLFQHSSFLAGGATTAAGRLVAHGGVLEAIWPYSGHYLPTEENFREFISFLEDNHVDLKDVKKCSVDDDDVSSGFSFKAGQSEPQSEPELKPKPLIIPHQKPVDILRTPTNPERTSAPNMDVKASPLQYNLANRMSCKWTSGMGARIGCLREYPTELQSRALEQVNLSPRVVPSNFANYGPIPSPRPSPKVRLSPRLSYMGLPSPRTPIAASS